MAQILKITLNFDSHITEVKEGGYSHTVTTSGQIIETVGTRFLFTVTLTAGYVLDTVVASTGTISDVTDNEFRWVVENTTEATITLTSKVAATKKSVDLTTLSGWANLSSGNHTIKIKAKGTGYKDSELSAGVTVSKAASTVTLSAGTYKFVDSPQFYTVESDETIGVDLSGKMNTLVAENTYGEMSPFTGITIYFSPVSSRNYVTISCTDENDINYINYQSSEWSYTNKNGEEFTTTDTTKLRTIIFETDQQVSPEFYNWAITQGNLVKQAEGYTVTITYGGLEPNVCFYSLDNGLTWIDGYVAGQSKLVLNNVKQIKFKAEDDGHNYAGIYSDLLNVSLQSGYNDGPKYSENFTLTQDVNDVYFNSGAD